MDVLFYWLVGALLFLASAVCILMSLQNTSVINKAEMGV